MDLPSRLRTVLRGFELLSDAPVIPLNPNRVSGSHHQDEGEDSGSQPPPGAFARTADRAPYERFMARADAMITSAEHELRVLKVGAVRGDPLRSLSASDVRSYAYREGTARIRSALYEGLDDTTVAYIEGRTTEGVRKLRSAVGRGGDGMPLAAPLTSSRAEGRRLARIERQSREDGEL